MESNKLSTLVQIKNGFAFKSSEYVDEGIRVIRITNVQKGRIEDSQPKFYPANSVDSLSPYLIDEDDILMSLTGNVGRVGVFPKELMPAYLNQRVCSIKITSSKIDNGYLFYLLNSNNFENDAINSSTGVAQLNLSTRWLNEYLIPLPPLETQKKIAAILDQAQALIDNDKQILAKYDQFIQSVFLDMFGNIDINPKGWKKAVLGDITSSRLGKMLDKKKIKGDNLRPYIQNRNVHWNKFKLRNLEEMDFDENERSEFSLQYGDVLVCEGGMIGRAAIWKNELNECYFQKALHRVRVNADLLNQVYLVQWLKEMSRLNGFKDYVSSVTISHLTGVKLKSMKISLPPIDLQNQFAETIKQIELQKQLTQQSLQKSEELFQSLLQRAFKGELV